MTLSMPDSITLANLPGGYPAYAGYADGIYQTEAELRARFPSAELVIFTVTGLAAAHGVKIVPGADTEPGNLGATGAALWAKRALMADPGCRPVVYADLASEGYSMAEVIAELLKLGITRSQYRVLTAHYTGHAHICSPQTCQVNGQPIGFTADGTQWSSSFPGLNGSVIDMSMLADDFFGPPPSWVFGKVQGLGEVRGPHSLRLSWRAPAGSYPEPVHHYQVTVRQQGRDIPGFPTRLPYSPSVSHQWDYMDHPYDQAIVRACAVDGHCSEWAEVRW